jgi:hypothetical protein
MVSVRWRGNAVGVESAVGWEMNSGDWVDESTPPTCSALDLTHKCEFILREKQGEVLNVKGYFEPPLGGWG